MNAYEYLQALRAALAVLPDDEIESAMRYYEDYFLDAGDENAAQVIEQLGPPEQVAEAILRDFTGMARRRPEHFNEDKAQSAQTVDGVPLGKDGKPLGRKKGISPALLVILVVVGIFVGLPLASAIVAAIAAVVVGVAGLLAGIAVCAVVLPVAIIIGGAVLVLFSFPLWATPASALATLGAGLALGAVGVLLALLIIKLCMLFIPPIIRGLVALIRWPIQKIRDLLKRGA